MALAPALRRSPRAHRPLPQPANGAMASTSAQRRSPRARRPPPRLADSAMASTSARRRTARARRPLPPPADRGCVMASTPARARRRSSRGPAAQTFLPDEMWEEIFLRLDAAGDIVRVSATCSSFRSIVSARRFLRRFRSLHSPPVLGFLRYSLEFLPVGPPHRSAVEARALEQAADFTFSFLPDPSAWTCHDARDGRVLLSRRISTVTMAFEDFVVCDPLHRRYVKIPDIPSELLAGSIPSHSMALHVLPVLAPAAENDGDESFRVICTVHLQRQNKVMAFVFSSCNQTWRRIIHTTRLPNGPIECKPYYAHGCCYWMFSGKGYSLMLGTSEMKFSMVGLPPHNFRSRRAIAEAANGRLGFLAIGYRTMDLYSKNRQSNGVGAQEWQHNKLIPLPKVSGIKYSWLIEGTVGRYIALVAHHVICNESPPISEHFILDIKTLLVEKLCSSDNDIFYGSPYARFPPLLSSI